MQACALNAVSYTHLVFWLAGAFENAKPIHADNDTLALDSGYASLVPCKIDVTDYDFLAQLKNQLKVES